MAELEKEIHRMEGHRKYPLPKPPAKTNQGRSPANGNEATQMCDSGFLRLDRLLRYETSLEHALDRTLSQLERLQRRRDGQKNIDIRTADNHIGVGSLVIG